MKNLLILLLFFASIEAFATNTQDYEMLIQMSNEARSKLVSEMSPSNVQAFYKFVTEQGIEKDKEIAQLRAELEEAELAKRK